MEEKRIAIYMQFTWRERTCLKHKRRIANDNNVIRSNSIFREIFWQTIWVQVSGWRRFILRRNTHNCFSTLSRFVDLPKCRHVILPNELARLVPKSHLMTETEWRNLGVQQSPGWIHYMLHAPEPQVLLFRRPLPQQQAHQAGTTNTKPFETQPARTLNKLRLQKRCWNFAVRLPMDRTKLFM